jgi:hypothetical protein
MNRIRDNWPALPLDAWEPTYHTLHMWSQIAGKICLALTSPVNHFWNITFHITSRGLSTPLLRYRDGALTMAFDFIDHQFVMTSSDGSTRAIALSPKPVADFYREVMSALGDLGVEVRIWTMPVEYPNPIRFEEDVQNASYDKEYASRHWQILLAVAPVFLEFRSRFVGKCSPVHFFWGSFDLAVTRFNGRRAPERPGADSITREAYSHAVISHGFWPGDARLRMPAFYAYAAPEPDGFKESSIRPAGAFYSRELSNFILPYDEVCRASSPEHALMDFLESTYQSAANLAGWDRAALERQKLES